MRSAHPRGLLAPLAGALARRNVPLARSVILAMQAEFDSPLTSGRKKAGPFPDLPAISGGGAENRTPVHTGSPVRLYKLSRCSVLRASQCNDER